MSRFQRIGIQAPLGFASGLPLLLTGSTLTVWLEDAHVDIVTIGAFGLVTLPYNAKFLWAPLLDRYELPWLGRRRGWILLAQLLLAPVLFYMGMVDAATSAQTLAVVAIAVAFLSASQDVVVDAYRTDILLEDERGKGTAAYVTGYRVAMIVAGAGTLILADHVGWRYAYWALAGLIATASIVTFIAPEPDAITPPRTLREAVREPVRELAQRRGILLILGIVALYKLGDSFAAHMIGPFLRNIDFSKTEIGTIQKALGFFCTIVGASVGGIYADKIGVKKAMIVFGIAQALANVGYLALALTGKNMATLVVAIGVDNICNGLGTAAFVAFIMTLCHKRFSAFQYAFLTSCSSILGRLLSPSLGFIKKSAGWEGFFATTIAVAIPAIVLLFWYRSAEPAEPADPPE